MSESIQEKILVVEKDEELRNRIDRVLTEKGYEVHCFESSSAGIAELTSSDKSSYAIAVVSFKMPKMEGDEILKKIKDVSPDTRRILITDSVSVDIIIKAINTARLHSCLLLPFADKDLLSHIKHGCRKYKIVKKQKNLSRITRRQNKQMFKIAQNLKAKEEKSLNKIDKKKKQISLLKSKLKEKKETGVSVSLKKFIEEKGVEPSPDTFGNELVSLKDHIKDILEKAAGGGIILEPLSYKKILNSRVEKNEFKSEINKIIESSLMLLQETNYLGPGFLDLLEEEKTGKAFELNITEDKMKAILKLKRSDPSNVSLDEIKAFIEEKGVKVGIKEDEHINAWLSGAGLENGVFVIAKGKKPEHPKDAEVSYHFETEFRHAGKVDETGRIDFADRGDVPFVEKDTCLATKIFPQEGIPGINVLGEEVPVKEPLDHSFAAGTGTREEEEGTKIYAEIAGQPHLDSLGNVSVLPELKVDGDVNFETGNIEFDGNIIVTGIVKEGFSIKGTSLTAEQIEGAEIDLSGDLNVSSGIVDADLINVKGTIQAKYINNSNIYGFGDLIVQKEIIDSKVQLSGACINEGGKILSSDISAKGGISAGSIGTETSLPSRLKVGTDERILFFVSGFDAQIKKNKDKIGELEKRIAVKEQENQELHKIISEHAYTQDRSQLKLKNLEKEKFDLEAARDVDSLKKVYEYEAELLERAKIAEDEINKGFEKQNSVVNEISLAKDGIKKRHESNEHLKDEKDKLLEFTSKKESLPEVKATGTIMGKTKIEAIHTSLVIKEPVSRCKVVEVVQKDETSEAPGFHEIIVTDL